MRRIVKKINKPKDCYFCKEEKTPHFSGVETLRRYVTERGKIVGRARSGICSKHQKQLSKSIKHARHLALLPFVGQN